MTEWDATAYNRLNNPMQTWGEAVVAQLPLGVTRPPSTSGVAAGD